MRYDYYNISSDSVAETGNFQSSGDCFFLFSPNILTLHTNMMIFNFRTGILFFECFLGGAGLVFGVFFCFFFVRPFPTARRIATAGWTRTLTGATCGC